MLGQRLGRHIDGMVDAYYGPPELAAAVAAEPDRPARPAAGRCPGATRRPRGRGAPRSGPGSRTRPPRPAATGCSAQVVGLATTCAKLAGEHIGYADEVEACYGVRPSRVDEEVLVEAHRRLEEVLPGSGPLAERLVAWRESHAVPVDKLAAGRHSLAEARCAPAPTSSSACPTASTSSSNSSPTSRGRASTTTSGLCRAGWPSIPTFRSCRPGLAHLVAHEAYPGHHTEHTRKEVGLVRRRQWWEESIFLVGTPQCLLAEGLADLGLEVAWGRHPEPTVAAHLAPLGIRYDTEVVAAVADAGEALGAVRTNAAFRLHEDGADPDTVIDEVARWGLLHRDRAAKAVEFLTHPTWRAYLTCYVEGFPLCRAFTVRATRPGSTGCCPSN